MILKKFIAVVVLCAAGASSHAANFSFTGQFQYDNDVQLFQFTVGAPSEVSLRSWSYAGGTNASGQTIARGGFDPILALFDANGNRVGQQDDAPCGNVAADIVTNRCFDTFFTTILGAGVYTASIQQYDNFSNGNLSAGFVRDGVQYRQFRNGFVDESGDRRNASWAFDILNVNSADLPPPVDVPEPSSISLLGAAMLGMLTVFRRRKV